MKTFLMFHGIRQFDQWIDILLTKTELHFKAVFNQSTANNKLFNQSTANNKTFNH
jgi:predicted aminopeptidase